METHIEKGYTSDEQKQINEKAKKMLVWLGIAGIIMVFAGLTSAYIVRKGNGAWLIISMPAMFYLSTAIILFSSLTMNWALSSIKNNNTTKLKSAILTTLVLGLLFGVFQFLAWGELIDNNIFFTGKSSNAAGSFLYVLSGLHLAHIAAGILVLLIIYYNAARGKYSSENYLGVKLGAIYWHFLDALWVYLFLFFTFFK
ncbi:MAG: cytochrome c oxidase subunit 3 [Bacteroidetes bacterium]|nr:cytochrome c oxidase subunit 3 [Bacteroidota bacterium]